MAKTAYAWHTLIISLVTYSNTFGSAASWSGVCQRFLLSLPSSRPLNTPTAMGSGSDSENLPSSPLSQHEAPYCHQPGSAKYSASCYCGAIRYEVLSDPETAKLCHCRGCQKLHGAPYEWVCIFHKHRVRFVSGTENLYFFNGEIRQGWDSKNALDRILPVKVSCQTCRTPIADEGRRMWLAYGTLFDFPRDRRDGRLQIPESFRHQCHLFYSQRVMDLHDYKPKWSGHKDQSELIGNGHSS